MLCNKLCYTTSPVIRNHLYERPPLIAAMFYLCDWAFSSWEVFTGTCCIPVSLLFILYFAHGGGWIHEAWALIDYLLGRLVLSVFDCE